jgi:integrase/recombinase XerD
MLYKGDRAYKFAIFKAPRMKNYASDAFKHAVAIISYMSEADVYKMMRSLGHEKMETTMIYLEKVFEKEQHVIHDWEKGVLGTFL